MGQNESSVMIQDNNSELNVSVVECVDDPTLNAIVVVNVDGTDI
jgi:hypothetical protein